MTSGMFITFEGGEGTGKSTQLRLLAEWLTARGRVVVQTREPGGTPQAEQLRTLLVSGATDSWSPQAEALLNYAARDSHLNAVIRPALADGKLVLCDRFMDSTRAYQGYAGGCSMALLDALEREVVSTTRPRLTLVFDLAPENGLARAAKRGGVAEDRFERKGLAFHQKLREGFLDIALRNSDRCKVVDATGSVEDVAKRITAIVEQALG